MVYAGTVQTPCGQALKGYPVFYCPSNQTIYSSAGSTADYGESIRLGGYWIAFHEYAHHVQQRIGVLNAAYTRDEDQLQISRRIELQADCMMAMTGISMQTTELNDQRPGGDGALAGVGRRRDPRQDGFPAVLDQPRLRHRRLPPVQHLAATNHIG